MNQGPTPRSTVRRLGERGRYDSDSINGIIDGAMICHVGFLSNGHPAVIPTIHTRIDRTLYLHGSPASHMLRSLKTGIEVSVAITHVDGLVLARSPFHHSMNYRSVVVFGTALEVRDPQEKSAALDGFVEQLVPGRSGHVRTSTDKEIAGTLVLALDLAEASAKVRTGPPADDESDYDLDIWAGVIPVGVSVGEPVADERNRDGVVLPEHIERWQPPQNR